MGTEEPECPTFATLSVVETILQARVTENEFGSPRLVSALTHLLGRQREYWNSIHHEIEPCPPRLPQLGHESSLWRTTRA